MALLDFFKKKKEGERFQKKQKEKSEISKTEETKDTEKKVKEKDLKKASGVLVSPHITEKATSLGKENAYVFKISPEANKIMVKQAIKKVYGVTPQKINITYKPSKKRLVRGKFGTRTGFKKAVVYLKEGDKIEIS